VKSRTRTTSVADSEAPDNDEPNPSQQTKKNHVVPGSPMSAMTSTINKITLELSPSVTITGAYLGMGLASQLGFFTNANQYQNQAMVAMAAVSGSIKRQPSNTKMKQVNSLLLGSTGPTPGETTSETHTAEDAEKAMRECGF
jgi:hypothetical protein